MNHLRTTWVLRGVCLVVFATLAAPVYLPAEDPAGAADKKNYPLTGTLVRYEEDADRIQLRTEDHVLHAIPLTGRVEVRMAGNKVDPGLLEQGDTITVAYPKASSNKPKEKGSPSKEKAMPKAKESLGNFSLAYPTGDRATSVLLIEMSGPEKMRVGQPATFTAKFTNLTTNLVLEKIRLRQRIPDGVEIASTKGTSNRQAGKKSGDQASESKDSSWHIGWLQPGESKTMEARIVGHEGGSKSLCFSVDYQPSLCLRADFVQPELTLTKEAPKFVNRCDAFTFRYQIKNTGTAPTKGLVIRDELPSGLRLASATSEDKAQPKEESKAQPKAKANETVVRFDVGELKVGQSREFTVKVLADRVGVFTSAATAGTKNDVETQSKMTTTIVQQANLAVEIEGPDSELVDLPITYKITVTNRGGADAHEAKLDVDLGSLGRLQPEDGDKQKGGSKSADGKRTWDLKTLGAGESRQVTMTVTGQKKGDMKVTATARSHCDRDIESATARATLSTTLRVLPALRLTVIDLKDPVKVGDKTSYKITVLNQGTGPDQNVGIKVTLPGQLKFLEASGTTKGKGEGQTFTADPVERLGPGEKAEWIITADAKQAADARTRVELSSDYLSKPVPDVEPTRLID